MEKHCFCCFFALPSIRQKGPWTFFSYASKEPMITDTGQDQIVR